ncbi:MAG: hypothetical protein WAN46_20205 [Gammaproteobacteria bacterium]|jgi:hypothetical protein
MSTKVLIGNLAAGTTLEELREVLVQRGWPLLKLERVEEGDLERLTFVAEVDIDPQTAKIMADQSGSHYFKGRKVTFYVSSMMG